jgi:hypothetical protein
MMGSVTRSVAQCRHIAVLALLAAPLPLAAQGRKVAPLFEIFATYSRPPLASAVADAYSLSGGLKAGAGVGAAVGVSMRNVELAGFYEIATTSLAQPVSAGDSRDFTRKAAGVRLEVELATIGAQFRGLVSGSAFLQSLGRAQVEGRLANGQPTATLVTVSQSEALGGRIEAGVEHRGFINTVWFVTGGVSMAGAGRGAWRENTDRRGGFGAVPIVTLGLRTRDWSR